MSGFQVPMAFDDLRVILDMPVRTVFDISVVVKVETIVNAVNESK